MRSVEVVKNEDGSKKYVVHSVSGNERNKLFINGQGSSFVDASAFSGANSKADSRCVAYADLNHDGFQDLIVINANNPHIEIFANRFSEQQGGNFIAVRLQGGNDSAAPSNEWSNRDGIGAILTVDAGGKLRTRELRCGEGFAAQNSNTILFGLGELSGADSVHIRWPSGKTQNIPNVEAGQVVRFIETEKNPSASRWDDTFEFAKSKTAGSFAFENLILNKDHRLRVFTTLETTCPNCRRSVPLLASLTDNVKELPVSFYALLTDADDKPTEIEKFIKDENPSYKILDEMSAADRASVKNFVAASLGANVSPCYMITDATGNLLYLETDMPTISDIRRFLYESTTH